MARSWQCAPKQSNVRAGCSSVLPWSPEKFRIATFWPAPSPWMRHTFWSWVTTYFPGARFAFLLIENANGMVAFSVTFCAEAEAAEAAIAAVIINAFNFQLLFLLVMVFSPSCRFPGSISENAGKECIQRAIA